jgi:hypothetical protein
MRPSMSARRISIVARRSLSDVSLLASRLGCGSPFAANRSLKAALYEAFPPEEARRLALRFEWHDTPKHGSWLNMAESELGVLASQCLDRRIEDQATLAREAAAWTKRRNTHNAKADWRFTTADARIKLKKLYPSL